MRLNFGKVHNTLKQIPCQGNLSYASITCVDIYYLKNNSLRIKGKIASIVIDPSSKLNKTEGDGVLILKESLDFSESKIVGLRITIKGPGEYEVGGIKISCFQVGRELVASLDVDSVKVLIGGGSAVEKIHEKMEECNIALIKADEEFNYAVLPSLEPNVLLVYGERKEEMAKSLGKEGAEKASKFSLTAEKLPQEMQIVMFE